MSLPLSASSCHGMVGGPNSPTRRVLGSSPLTRHLLALMLRLLEDSHSTSPSSSSSKGLGSSHLLSSSTTKMGKMPTRAVVILWCLS